jgi:hypothetical protein
LCLTYNSSYRSSIAAFACSIFTEYPASILACWASKQLSLDSTLVHFLQESKGTFVSRPLQQSECGLAFLCLPKITRHQKFKLFSVHMADNLLSEVRRRGQARSDQSRECGIDFRG